MRVNLTESDSGKQAQTKQAHAQQIFESIRADDRLSPEGKRERLAHEWWTRRKEVKSLEQVELTSRRDRRDSLHRHLFGGTAYPSGTDIISQRDAADRASRVSTPDEAEQLITQARRNGDAVLAKAVALHAFERTWTGALEHWADGNSVIEDQLTELYSLSARENPSTEMASLLGHAMTFDIEKPIEVRSMTHGELDAAVGESTSGVMGQPTSVATDMGRSDRSSDYDASDNWVLDSAV